VRQDETGDGSLSQVGAGGPRSKRTGVSAFL